LKSIGKKITILAIGPLTNIGLLLFNHPDVKNYIEKLVFMGGSLGINFDSVFFILNMYNLKK
jgi:non-specific riboncleoside hydrolase